MGIVEESTVDDYELPDLVTDNQRQLVVFWLTRVYIRDRLSSKKQLI